MFAHVGGNGRVEFLLPEKPKNADNSWHDVSGIEPAPQIGWITQDGGKTFSDPREPSLDQARVSKLFALRLACSNQIQADFASSSLGAAHAYPADDASQTNMLAATVAASSLWCADAAGAWDLRAHTIDQARQVMADFVVARLIAQQKLVSLTAEIQSATTASAIKAIGW